MASVRRKCCCEGPCSQCTGDVDSYTVSFIDVQLCSGCVTLADGSSLQMTTTTINKSFCFTRNGTSTDSQACIWSYTENPNVTLSGTYYSTRGDCLGASVAVLPKFSISISRALGSTVLIQWVGTLLTGNTTGATSGDPSYRIWNQTASATTSPCFETDWMNPATSCSSTMSGGGIPFVILTLGYGGTLVITPNC